MGSWRSWGVVGVKSEVGFDCALCTRSAPTKNSCVRLFAWEMGLGSGRGHVSCDPTQYCAEAWRMVSLCSALLCSEAYCNL